MSKSEFSYNQRAVIENAKWVDKVLFSGVTLAGIAVVAKLLGLKEIEFQTLKISTDYAWIIAVVFTIAHFYTAWLLRRAIVRLLSTEPEDKCLEVFSEVTLEGGIFVRGIIPRIEITNRILGIPIYKMRIDDPSTWAAHVLAIVVIAGITPFDTSNDRYFAGMLLLAVAITASNWLIGSVWIVMLSALGVKHEEVASLRSQSANSSRSGYELVNSLYDRLLDFVPSYSFPLSLKVAPLLAPLLLGAVLMLITMAFLAVVQPSGVFWDVLGGCMLFYVVGGIFLGLVKEISKNILKVNIFSKLILVTLFVFISFCIVIFFIRLF
jgi:hypothetical protein